jgi:hypothetical protein
LAMGRNKEKCKFARKRANTARGIEPGAQTATMHRQPETYRARGTEPGAQTATMHRQPETYRARGTVSRRHQVPGAQGARHYQKILYKLYKNT